jgi:hypothetical protein
MSQYTTRPRPRGLFAHLLQTAARVGQAGAQGLAYKQGGAQGEQEPGCTPCAAMARRDAARKIVSGG